MKEVVTLVDIEHSELVKIVNATFTKIMKVFSDNTFIIFKKNEGEQVLRYNFSDWIKIFMDDGNVHEDDKEKYLDFYNYERIMLDAQPIQMCEYRRRAGNEWTTVRAFISLEEDGSFYLYLTNIGGTYGLGI